MYLMNCRDDVHIVFTKTSRDCCRDTLNVSLNSFAKQDARSASLQNYRTETPTVFPSITTKYTPALRFAFAIF